MARGYIYEIVDNNEDVGELTEDWLYDDLKSLDIDYAQNIDPITTKELRNFIIENFSKCGAKTGFKNNIPWFILTDKVKKNYFQDRFIKLKNKVSKMTINEFALSDPWEIQSIIEERWSDCVANSDGSIDTMDDFIRTAKTDKTYYIGNVVLMH